MCKMLIFTCFLFAQNAFELRAPASLTKIMTAYLALKYCSMDETVVIGTEFKNSDEQRKELISAMARLELGIVRGFGQLSKGEFNGGV